MGIPQGQIYFLDPARLSCRAALRKINLSLIVTLIVACDDAGAAAGCGVAAAVRFGDDPFPQENRGMALSGAKNRDRSIV